MKLSSGPPRSKLLRDLEAIFSPVTRNVERDTKNEGALDKLLKRLRAAREKREEEQEGVGGVERDPTQQQQTKQTKKTTTQVVVLLEDAEEEAGKKTESEAKRKRGRPKKERPPQEAEEAEKKKNKRGRPRKELTEAEREEEEKKNKEKEERKKLRLLKKKEEEEKKNNKEEGKKPKLLSLIKAEKLKKKECELEGRDPASISLSAHMNLESIVISAKCQMCGDACFQIRKPGDVQRHLRASHSVNAAARRRARLPLSLFEGLDTPEGVFMGEVLISAVSESDSIGVGIAIDCLSISHLSATSEKQQALLTCVCTALSASLLSECVLFPIGISGFSVLRVWFDRSCDIAQLSPDRTQAAFALMRLFNRPLAPQ